jgi:enoyl-CoA hydratase/carnithine racemase
MSAHDPADRADGEFTSRCRWTTVDEITVLTFSAPERANALTRADADDITSRLTQGQPAPRPLVIRADGPNFCAGVHLAESARYAGHGREYIRSMLIMQETLTFYQAPVVALVQGAVIGAGMEICVAADTIVATNSAFFCLPESRMGMVPGYSTLRLPGLIGESRARELIFSGRKITATEAVEMGLVLKVVPESELLPEGMRQAATMAVTRPEMLAWAKRQMAGPLLSAEELCAVLADQFDRVTRESQGRSSQLGRGAASPFPASENG